MSASPHLNQTIYGSPIPPYRKCWAVPQPPATEPSPPPSRTESNACNWYFCISIKLLTIILFLVGIVILSLWLINEPKTFQTYTEEASLSTFNLSRAAPSSNQTLSYKLSVNLSFQNPNKKRSFFYEQMHALALYHGYRIGYMTSLLHYQGQKSSAPVTARFEGVIRATKSMKRNFRREEGEGFFNVGIKFYTELELKMFSVKSEKFKPIFYCYLRLPDPSNSTSAATGFKRTKCRVSNYHN